MEKISISLLKKENNFSYTYNHCQAVSKYSAFLAQEINLNQEKIEGIKIAAVLHDIGKIAVPHFILHKPERLTKEEFEVIKLHPSVGYNILKGTGLNKKIHLNSILYHHERYDGQGYPEGLKGEEIPLEARIVGIADAFDAMTSKRPYNKALSIERGLKELKDNAGSQFDPYLVEVFVNSQYFRRSINE
ncbi:HD-GYP domain-containing protein [Halonatronum saccharophilum]|uniref:HD-GYP domain-containing protein n=1 Tax=Halonatronum saccharophilum TaxID=150060 RepID=UPI000553F1CA|nr:HD-GYP domain-containing protein [Halonatronum saccharophilum]